VIASAKSVAGTKWRQSIVLTSFDPADFKIYFSRKISRFLLELCSASVFLQKKIDNNIGF
jgi:hypothetical protein